jgi:hypothetical protein
MAIRKSNPKVSAKFFPKTKPEEIDTVRDYHSFGKRDDVLMDAHMAWDGLWDFRKKSRRNKMYTFEDQWGDKIKTKHGYMTERKSITEQGNSPLTNNRIRGIIRSVSGVFQSQQTEPVCIARDRKEQEIGEIMSSTIQYVYQLNKLWGLDSNNFNYFLVTGLAAFKSTFGEMNGKVDVWNNIVNYNRLFFDNHMQDPRHWDCHLIGEIHDVGLYDVIKQFSASPEEAEKIRRIYSDCTSERTMSYLENLTYDNNKDLNFFIPRDPTRCRVIEVWKKESKARYLVHDKLTGDYYKTELEDKPTMDMENRNRYMEQSANGVAPENMKLLSYKWFVDNYWYYYFLSPRGDVLREGETPFWHESHPYSFRLYPFYDSQVYPFVGDFIDQQRYINRLIMLQDFIIRSSAKGVLAIAEESKADGWEIQDYADEWAVFNGVILYKSKGGAPPPEQIVSNSRDLGVTEMLSIQLKLLEEISGVQGALQGKAPAAGTPASLYMQQTQNAATSLTELFEAYRELREDRDMKNLKLIQQYYTDPKYINITGKTSNSTGFVYDPKRVRNVEFDLSITESQSTPAYRLVMNEFLMQLFGAGQITLSELLENGAFPFADKLLQSVKLRQQEMQAAQSAMASGGAMPPAQGNGFIPQDIGSQLDQNVDPLVHRMFNNQNAT